MNRFYPALLTPDVCISANASHGHRFSHQVTALIPIATVIYCLPVWMLTYMTTGHRSTLHVLTYLGNLCARAFLHICHYLATYMCVVGSHY